MSDSMNRQQSLPSLLLIALLALLIWLPLPIGSEFQWAISLAECGLFLIAAVGMIQIGQGRAVIPPGLLRARPVLVMLLLYLLWLWLQTVPMPIAWLATLSPHAAAMHTVVDPESSYATISLAPYETRLHFFEALFLGLLFMLLIWLVDSRVRVSWLIYTILSVALAEVLYGTLMVLTGVEYSFFIAKSDILSHIGSATGTFHSRNTLAAYLEMALAVGIGYLLSQLAREKNDGSWKRRARGWIEVLLGPKMRLRLLLILLCLGLVMTHSRGGNIGFFTSLAVAGGLFLLAARRRPRATVIFLVSVIVVDIVLIGSWVGLSKVMDRLEHTSVQTEMRDDVYRQCLPLIKDYALSGSGAGSFNQLFPAYKSGGMESVGVRVDYAFNDLIQYAVESGLFGLLLLTAIVAYTLFITILLLRRESSSTVQGIAFSSLMGVTAIIIHSMVDYPMQMLATSSLFMVLLAMPYICFNLAGERKRRGKSRH